MKRVLKSIKPHGVLVCLALSVASLLSGLLAIAFHVDGSTPSIIHIVQLAFVAALLFILVAAVCLHALNQIGFPYVARAMPERVRDVLDLLTEGVLVLDMDGNVLMANKAFFAIAPPDVPFELGKTARQLEWIWTGLKGIEGEACPWAPTTAGGRPIVGLPLEVNYRLARPRRFLVNCVGLKDHDLNPTGYLITLDDISAIKISDSEYVAALAELKTSRDVIGIQNRDLMSLASTDPLTSCLNRRAFESKSHDMLERGRVLRRPLTCVMCDIDKFKAFNDNFGHQTGDEVLKQVAGLLRAALRTGDLLCRYGGEEFCLLMKDISEEGALALCERLRRTIELNAGKHIKSVAGLTVTMSFGVSINMPSSAEDLSTMITRADAALYQAKSAGRNKVVLFQAAKESVHPD